MTDRIGRVSVIISTYTPKRLHDVMKCIASLETQTLKPTEVLLVLDPDENLVNFYKSRIPSKVKIITSDKVGLSHARNAGIKRAVGDIIAFIDDDAVADPTWLETMIRNYDDPEVVGVGGLIKANWQSRRPLWFPEELDWIVGCTYKGFPERRIRVRNPIGCSMSFRSWVFRKVGYFRSDIGRRGQNFTGDEETEFSIRACNKIPKSKVMYDPSSVVHHKIGRNRESLNYVWKRSFSEGISKAMMTHKQKTSQLSAEDAYLKYLLGTAIPSRITKIYKYENMCQLLVLLYSTVAVLAGFASSKL